MKPIQQEELRDAIRQVLTQSTEGDEETRRWGDKETDDRDASPSPGLPVSLASARPLRILLAEDNDLNQQVVQHFLARHGHTVQVAKDGREALAALEQDAFDLLLLDLHMPEMDGFRVIEAVRRREQSADRRLPVVALTARSMKGDRERCLQAGMDEYVAKPVRRAELFAAIERVLAGRPAAEPAPRPAAPASGLLDAAMLLTACDADPALLGQMIDLFQTGAPGCLARLSDAVANRNAAEVREAAHKLCGLVSAFSTLAAEAAQRLEQTAAAGRLDDAVEPCTALADMIRNLGPLLAGLSIEDLKSRLGQDGAKPLSV